MPEGYQEFLDMRWIELLHIMRTPHRSTYDGGYDEAVEKWTKILGSDEKVYKVVHDECIDT